MDVNETGITEEYNEISKADAKHNMKVIIMLDAIFLCAAADLYLVLQPFLVYLKASNFMIGLINNPMALGSVGILISPFITRKFKRKKWYLFAANVPYLLPIGVIGFLVVFSQQLTISNETLLNLTFGLMMFNGFAGGFCSLPHSEYVAACIPMSSRGKYTGLSLSIGGITGIVSAAIGGVILAKLAKPASFGYLFLMFWFIAQGGYLIALMGRERPSPVEKSPKAWSKSMLTAFIKDKPFLKMLFLYASMNLLIAPAWTFVSVFGFSALKMAAALSAVLMIIQSSTRFLMAPAFGFIADKIGHKRLLPYTFILSAIALLPILLIPNAWGVYISTFLYSLELSLWITTNTPLIYGLPKAENRAGHYTIQILIGATVTTVGNMFIGYLCDELGYKMTFIGVGVISLLMFPIAVKITSAFSDKFEDYG